MLSVIVIRNLSNRCIYRNNLCWARSMQNRKFLTKALNKVKEWLIPKPDIKKIEADRQKQQVDRLVDGLTQGIGGVFGYAVRNFGKMMLNMAIKETARNQEELRSVLVSAEVILMQNKDAIRFLGHSIRLGNVLSLQSVQVNLDKKLEATVAVEGVGKNGLVTITASSKGGNKEFSIERIILRDIRGSIISQDIGPKDGSGNGGFSKPTVIDVKARE